MSLIEIGRLAVKLSGRDAGKTCTIIDLLDENFVLIDGQTRRRKCNIKHLELLSPVLSLRKGASHQEVKSEFQKMNLEVLETKPKAKTEKPKPKRKVKTKIEKEEKVVKKKKVKEAKASAFEEAVEKESKKEE